MHDQIFSEKCFWPIYYVFVWSEIKALIGVHFHRAVLHVSMIALTLFKLQMKWKLIHLPSVYSFTYLLTDLSAWCSCIQFKAYPGFRACLFITSIGFKNKEGLAILSWQLGSRSADGDRGEARLGDTRA